MRLLWVLWRISQYDETILGTLYGHKGHKQQSRTATSGVKRHFEHISTTDGNYERVLTNNSMYRNIQNTLHLRRRREGRESRTKDWTDAKQIIDLSERFPSNREPASPEKRHL
ncbi:hypothetical protein RRG08_033039 [Elysia crispata]|uniref:Uncharacterized protein n=1 Tax=Elysia crispata TaxID=231223 RepID=A0AAE1DUU8_9GAST|nr:hypothetical protein RRG08_033039 [Elysia crispata]